MATASRRRRRVRRVRASQQLDAQAQVQQAFELDRLVVIRDVVRDAVLEEVAPRARHRDAEVEELAEVLADAEAALEHHALVGDLVVRERRIDLATRTETTGDEGAELGERALVLLLLLLVAEVDAEAEAR